LPTVSIIGYSNINISNNRYLILHNYHQKEEDITLTYLSTVNGLGMIKDKPKSIGLCIRETRWTEETLKQLHSDLKAIRMKAKPIDKISELMKPIFKQPALPITPRRSGIWDSEQKKREESAIFIQKLIKGRAIQCLVK